MRRLSLFFIAGFLAVPFFHQPILGLLHAYGVVPFAPFNTAATVPLGVPAWLSASFWGGVWGMLMLSVLRWDATRPQPWLKGLLFGGIALTSVALLIVFPLKGLGFSISQLPGRFLIGFLVNAAWGVGTLLFARTLFTR
ncbi:MAG: hypothetical protein KJ884_20820 [Gammaproteobacteria bacterium]|jgi:hypothetical protein|uniref:Transmembrane protein n=1 Tax=Pseudomonas cuatrocienegasensis TaxID=543360 RepID=A0ABY1BQB7_9PSED|nr:MULTISPECIES: hypothetical protein [Pseudomonas]MBU1329306.1 hypothetical protein [Gammaproteobacteria bacterium]MBU1491763.1 hypothetical protein [Gammaproteobacteria bacterium]MBU2064492.1 hypothetical protein [Gammaproteobacteria bacterium]MBU2138129.1 hypothetical protein [Gammaproteobacteria bacterium]MBU2214944.1 hypothetical protein [Gammaproteobacteria bacterium]